MSCYWIFYCLYWILENLVGKICFIFERVLWLYPFVTKNKNNQRGKIGQELTEFVNVENALNTIQPVYTAYILNGKWVRPIFSLTFKRKIVRIFIVQSAHELRYHPMVFSFGWRIVWLLLKVSTFSTQHQFISPQLSSQNVSHFPLSFIS